MRITSQTDQAGHEGPVGQRPFRVRITNEEIMADLMYPARTAKPAARSRPLRRVRGR